MQPRNALEDPRTKQAVYVVEATSHEAHALWMEYSTEALAHGWGTRTSPRVPWEQHFHGWHTTVGTLETKDSTTFPVTMDLTFWTINGKLVLFYSDASRVVDHDMLEAWLREHVPAYADHHTNATNFGHCLSFVRDTH